MEITPSGTRVPARMDGYVLARALQAVKLLEEAGPLRLRNEANTGLSGTENNHLAQNVVAVWNPEAQRVLEAAEKEQQGPRADGAARPKGRPPVKGRQVEAQVAVVWLLIGVGLVVLALLNFR